MSPCLRPSRLLLCLLLGALTTVLIAWSLRAYYQWRNTPVPLQRYSLTEGGQSWEATVIRAPGRCSIMYEGMPPPGSDWQRIRPQGEPDPIPFTNEPAWAAAARRSRPRLVSTAAYGLPFPCLMTCSVFSSTPGGIDNVGLLTTPTWLGPAGGIRLPLRPMWTGAAADTAIFSGLWCTLLTGSTALRRAHRRRRGLCPACAYNLAGNTSGICPECGHVTARNA